MIRFFWHKSIALTAATVFALAPLANAQDITALTQETQMLHASEHVKIMRAATAACLLTPKDRNAVLTKLENAGWRYGGEEEWIEADHNDVWVTLMGSTDDFFCDIQGDISQSAALASVKDLLIAADWGNWAVVPEGGECFSLTHPQGIGIYITSSGNDPVCTPTPHSAIRISAQGD